MNTQSSQNTFQNTVSSVKHSYFPAPGVFKPNYSFNLETYHRVAEANMYKKTTGKTSQTGAN